jgi:hypothetical protein
MSVTENIGQNTVANPDAGAAVQKLSATAAALASIQPSDPMIESLLGAVCSQLADIRTMTPAPGRSLGSHVDANA